MANNFDQVADKFFQSPEGAKLSGKKSDIEKLINTPDGQKVKSMLDGGSIMSAVENGDMNTLKSTLGNILKTQEGARLVNQLSDMFKK